jgi:hypothetical protein
MNIADPFGAIADIIVGVYQTKKIQGWVSLLFQTFYSSVVVFCSACGGSLVASKSWPVSVGLGLIGIATTMVIFFVKSKLTKGMLLVAPTDIVNAEQASHMTEIQK